MTTAAIIAAGEAHAAHVATMPRTQLIRGVDMDDKMQLKITGKNSDGEYWLHLVGGGQNAGFNLGDPSTMVGAALLKAASGQRFVSAENPPCAPADPVLDDRVRPLLLAQAKKRGAFDWRCDDAEPVIADLLAARDVLVAAVQAARDWFRGGDQAVHDLCKQLDATLTAYKDAQK